MPMARTKPQAIRRRHGPLNRKSVVGLEGFEPSTHGLGKPSRWEPRFFRPLLGIQARPDDSRTSFCSH